MAEDASLTGKRILIVEDEMIVAMDLEDLLQREGCTVLGPVPSVARALSAIEAENPDAVLLDLNLGGDAAIPVAETLVARSVPFVVMSGYSTDQSRDSAIASAPRVGKPVDYRKLVRTLRELCT